MADVPLEIIKEILSREKNDRRFEELVAAVFSKIHGIRFSTTAPTGDKGRDGYAELVGEIASTGVTTQDRGIKKKITSDIDSFVEGTEKPIKYYRYCCTQQLMEETRDELESYAKSKMPFATITTVDGLDQIASRMLDSQEVFQQQYSREIATVEVIYRRAKEDDRSNDQDDVFRVAVAAAYDPALDRERSEVLRELLLTALAQHRKMSRDALSGFVARQLKLAAHPRQEYLSSAIEELLSQNMIVEDVVGYQLSERGIAALSEQLRRAADAVFEGREIFDQTFSSIRELIADSTFNRLWRAFQEQVANEFLLNGHRLLEELRILAEAPTAREVELPEFEAFLSQIAREAKKLGISPIVMPKLYDALTRFTDPADAAWKWLTELAIKYLVLCSLGLDPEIEKSLVQKLQYWVITPDTHMVISALCRGEEHHTQCHGVLTALPKLGCRTVVMESVVEETAHHAELAKASFERFVERYESLSGADRPVAAYHLISMDDNAFVKAFVFQCGNTWKPSDFTTFMRNFRDLNSSTNFRMMQLLKSKFKASTTIDDHAIKRDAKQYAEAVFDNQTGQAGIAKERRTLWDGRFICSIRRQADTLEMGEKVVVVTDHSAIREYFRKLSETRMEPILVTRPANLACILMFAPGTQMNLECLKHFLFSRPRTSVASDSALLLHRVVPKSTSNLVLKPLAEELTDRQMTDDKLREG